MKNVAKFSDNDKRMLFHNTNEREEAVDNFPHIGYNMST